MKELTFTSGEGQLRGERLPTREETFLRIGSVCAILGAIVSVAAGVGFGNLTNESTVETVLQYLASRPRWYWPIVHLGFVFGALLWVGAFIALARSLTGGALGWLGAVSIIMGATIHIVDSSISGFGLAALAHDWAAAPATEQTSLVQDSHTLLQVLGGTWASVLSFFHGLPFILSGLAVARSLQYPSWLGWVGVIGGAGSLVAGVMMFIGASFVPSWLFIVFALIVSLWMVAIGVLMWRRASNIR
jgi:hypothetical protein